MDVEGRGRLIQEQQIRLLGQNARQQHSLPLSSGQGAEITVAQMLRFRFPHTAQHDFPVAARRGPQRPQMRIPSQDHHFRRGQRESRGDGLRKKSEDTGPFAVVEGAERLAIQQHRSPGGLQKSAEKAQKRAFPGAVRSDNAHDLAAGHTHIGICQNRRLGLICKRYAL